MVKTINKLLDKRIKHQRIKKYGKRSKIRTAIKEEAIKGQSGIFSVGDAVTIEDTGVSTTDGVITVYIIHKPTNQKIFSSTTVSVK